MNTKNKIGNKINNNYALIRNNKTRKIRHYKGGDDTYRVGLFSGVSNRIKSKNELDREKNPPTSSPNDTQNNNNNNKTAKNRYRFLPRFGVSDNIGTRSQLQVKKQNETNENADIGMPANKKRTIRGRIYDVGKGTSNFFKNRTRKMGEWMGFRKKIDLSGNDLSGNDLSGNDLSGNITVDDKCVQKHKDITGQFDNMAARVAAYIAAKGLRFLGNAGIKLTEYGADKFLEFDQKYGTPEMKEKVRRAFNNAGEYADLFVEAMDAPINKGIDTIAQANSKAMGSLASGAIKVGTDMLGAVPFLGAVVDAGKAVNDIGHTAYGVLHSGNQAISAASSIVNDTAKNLEQLKKEKATCELQKQQIEQQQKQQQQQQQQQQEQQEQQEQNNIPPNKNRTMRGRMYDSVKNRTRKLGRWMGFRNKNDVNQTQNSNPNQNPNPNQNQQMGGKILKRTNESINDFKNPLIKYSNQEEDEE
jgi:hypothetical protein